MIYHITFRHAVLREMRSFPRSTRRRLWAAIDELRENPFPAGMKNVRGYNDYYRIHVGEYRIVYHVATKNAVITIIKMRHRKDVYRSM